MTFILPHSIHKTIKQRHCLMLKLNEKADYFRSRTGHIMVRYSRLLGIWQIKSKGHFGRTFTVLLLKQNGKCYECQHRYLKLFYIHAATWLHNMFKLPIRKQMTLANGNIKCSEHVPKQKTQSHTYKITGWKGPSNLSQFNHIISEMRKKLRNYNLVFFKKKS